MKICRGAGLAISLTGLLSVGWVSTSPSMTTQVETQGQTRGLFLESRPKTAKNRTKPAAKTMERQTKTTQAAAPLAFGYTLFLDNGSVQTRVSAARVFRSGERVRLLVETNHDAFLYVFHREGSGPALLIFPDSRVAGGENRLAAHEPWDVPEGGWFAFDDNPGQERLTLVVSEQPLAGVPRGKDLARLERFQMSEEALAELVRGAAATITDTALDEGTPMRPAEETRGLKLTKADPPPSRVVMKKTPTASSGWVVSQIVLTHR